MAWFALYLAGNLMQTPDVQTPSRSIERLAYIRANRGSLRRVACWCAIDQPCHGDVLLAGP